MSRLPARGNSAEIVKSADYKELLSSLKQLIRDAQFRAAQAVNSELVLLYWAIGRDILTRQEKANWGDKVIDYVAADLSTEFAEQKRGYSRRNLAYMRQFAGLWPDADFVQSVIAQIGWTHHIQLLNAFGESPDLYAWYASKAAEGLWPVRHLKGQIDLQLHRRQGAATTNFASTIAPGQSGQVLAAIKDPYVFDFLDLAEQVKERHLESALIADIQRFMLELGAGFAFYGRQQPLIVGGQEFFLDLLFYHHKLRRFVVIDLKIGPFEAEHVGKMNFYLNAVDEQLRHEDDHESVGIILCTTHNDTVTKVALHRVSAPIGVATWKAGEEPLELPPVEIADEIPADMRDQLPGLTEVQERLTDHVAEITPRLQAEAVDAQAEEGDASADA